MTTPITVLDHAAFEVVLTPGIVEDEQFLKRDGQTLVGVAASSVTAGVATTALGLTELGGTALPMATVADGELLARVGATVDGIAQSALRVGGVRESGGTALPMGAVAEGSFVLRSAGTLAGLPQLTTAYLLAGIVETITPVTLATKSWDTTEGNLAVTYDAAACDITLPTEAQVTNWPVGELPPRKIYKMNSSAFGINLLAPATVTINGGAADADMTPIPDTDADPSNTVLAQCVHVYRASATAFWVFGGQ